MSFSPRPKSIDWQMQWKIAKSETYDWKVKSHKLERQVRMLNDTCKQTNQSLDQFNVASIEQLVDFMQTQRLQLVAAESQVQELRQTCEQQSANLEEQQDHLNHVTEQLNQELENSSSIQAEIESLGHELLALEQTRQEEIEQFKTEHQQANLKLDESQKLCSLMEERLKVLENALSRQSAEFESQFGQACAEIKALKTNNAAIEQEKERIAQSEHELQHNLDTVKSELESYESQTRVYEQEVEDARTIISRLNNENKCMQEYINKLEHDVDRGQVIFSQLSQAELAIHSLETRLENIKADEVSKQQEIENLQGENATQTRNIELLTADNSRLYEEIKQMGNSATDMNAYIVMLENNQKSLQKEVQDKERMCKLQLDQVELERCSKSQAAEKFEELQCILQGEQETIANFKQRISETEDLVNEKMAIISELRNEISVHKSVIHDQKLRIETHDNAQMIEKDHIRQNEELRRQVYAVQVVKNEAQLRLEMESKLRRQLQERLLEMKGTIRVFCRARPLLDHEMFREGSLVFNKQTGSVSVTQTTNGYNSINPKVTSFSFDQVFDASSTNADIFEEVDLLIQSIFNGFSCCIFAYGQTGSGKSYTMLSETGIVHKTIQNIFELMKITDHSTEYQVYASFFEIYNEQVIDITNISKNASPIHSNALKGVQEHTVVNTQGLIDLLEVGLRNRAVGTTKMNQDSSRSHTIFSIRINGVDRVTGKVTSGKLNLIDLAGSERLDKSQVTGVRLRETQAINKSLSALGDVIHAIGSKPRAHVPFRNSKLTHMLQDSLTGRSKTLMLVNVSPAMSSIQETLTSLRFAEKVNSTKLKE